MLLLLYVKMKKFPSDGGVCLQDQVNWELCNYIRCRNAMSELQT